MFAFVMAAPVMGHAFSVYYFYMKFRMKYINRGKNMPRVFADGNTGGKAIAVSFGVMLGLYPDTMPAYDSYCMLSVLFFDIKNKESCKKNYNNIWKCNSIVFIFCQRKKRNIWNNNNFFYCNL